MMSAAFWLRTGTGPRQAGNRYDLFYVCEGPETL